MRYEKQIYGIENCKKLLDAIKNCSHAIILESKDELLLDGFANLVILQDVCQFVKKPCFECANCQKVLNGNAIDVEIFGQEKSILVADSNKIVNDSFVVPLEFEKKYFLLKSFDRATEQAQNKLLKVLEEPQKFDKFILLTTNFDAILPTIKSRAEIFRLPILTNEDLFEILKNEFYEKEKLNKAILLSNGNLSKCLQILKDDDYFEMYNLCEKLVMFMTTSGQILEYASEILKFKDKIEDFFKILLDLYVNLLSIKSNTNTKLDAKQSQLKVIAGKYNELAITRIIKEINLAITKIKSKISTNEIVDNLLLNILEIRYLCK